MNPNLPPNPVAVPESDLRVVREGLRVAHEALTEVKFKTTIPVKDPLERALAVIEKLWQGWHASRSGEGANAGINQPENLPTGNVPTTSQKHKDEGPAMKSWRDKSAAAKSGLDAQGNPHPHHQVDQLDMPPGDPSKLQTPQPGPPIFAIDDPQAEEGKKPGKPGAFTVPTGNVSGSAPGYTSVPGANVPVPDKEGGMTDKQGDKKDEKKDEKKESK